MTTTPGASIRNGRITAAGQRSPLRVLVGGIMGMMLAMGISRFAFTPILPLMQRDLGMSHSLAGALASLNFVGYLAGALICAIWPRLLRSTAVNLTALISSIGTTFLMAYTTSPAFWGALRLWAGLASAILFVVIAVEVTETLLRSQHGRWSSALYGGVGLGIALSGFTVPLFDQLGGWRGAWLGMGALSLALAGAGVAIAGKRAASVDTPDALPSQGAGFTVLARLIFVYFLEGLGYIVSATFLVAIIAKTPGLAAFAPWSWVAVGLAAAPSTIVWQRVAGRIGGRPALTLAYLLQAGGILLSVGASEAWRACLAAVIFGGTFLGIVALVMAEGGRRAGPQGRRAAALLTAAFGTGQVIGPTIAGFLADRQGGFAVPLYLAAGAIFCAGVLAATDRRFASSRGAE